MSLPNLETSFGYRCLDQVNDCKNKVKRLEHPANVSQPKSILKSLQLGKLRQKFLSKINVLPMSFENEVQEYEPNYTSIDQYDCVIHGESYPWNEKKQYSKYLLNFDQELSASVPSSPRFLSSLRQSNKTFKNVFTDYVNNHDYDYDSCAPPPYQIAQSPAFSIPISSANSSCMSSPFHSPKRTVNQRNNLSQFYVPNSSIPFQEIREICLIKEKSEKYGFKVEKIGMTVYIDCYGVQIKDSTISNQLIEFLTYQILHWMLFTSNRNLVQIAADMHSMLFQHKWLTYIIQRNVTERLKGIFITNLLPDSPTVKAGLKVGDEIVRLNNLQISELSNVELIEQIKSSETCLKVSFKPRLVVMRLRDVIIRKVDGRLGIRLQKKPEGLFLAIVITDSPASRAGLKEGDELLKINNEIVSDWSQEKVTQYLRDISTDDSDLLLIVREYLPMAHILPGNGHCDSGLDEFNEISTGISEVPNCCNVEKNFINFT